MSNTKNNVDHELKPEDNLSSLRDTGFEGSTSKFKGKKIGGVKDYMRDDIVVLGEEDEFNNQKGNKGTDDDGSPQKKTVKSLVYDSCLMIWDGLPFFGFDETKLARLSKNGKYKFTDKCTSI